MRGPELIVAWRKRRGWSQTKAAEEIGIKQVQLCKYEAGRQKPSVDSAWLIHEATKGRVPMKCWVVDV